jgi:hypothetical protein
MKPLLAILFPALCLILAGCDDSTRPLSDPASAKADSRLAGVWRERADGGPVTYYHIGRADLNLPEGVMRAVGVRHQDGRVDPPEEYLMFPTTLGDKTYLNVISINEQVTKTLEEKGWKAESLDSYFILKYKVDGNKVLVWLMDSDTKKRAIESGKIKGLIEHGTSERVRFDDTTANLARFVAQAGDNLFAKEPIQFERIEAAK